MVFEPNDKSEIIEKEVFKFEKPGVALSMFNIDQSIIDFARASFHYGINLKWPVYLSTKNTILKIYDGRFKDLFQEVYEKEFEGKFKERKGKNALLKLGLVLIKVLLYQGILVPNIRWIIR